MATDELPAKKFIKNNSYEILIPLFEKYRHYDGSIPLRIFGRVVLFLSPIARKGFDKKIQEGEWLYPHYKLLCVRYKSYSTHCKAI